jgi:outer membrane protein OmpA-like peptidoglycan-associated protein
MTTLPRLGAVALLLASVSTIAVIAHGGASAAEKAPLERFAQAGPGGPPRGSDERGPGPKEEGGPQPDQQGEQGKEGEEGSKGKRERGQRDGGEKGGSGAPDTGPEPKAERKDRDRDRDRDQNGGGQEGPPHEKRQPRRDEAPPVMKKEPPPALKEHAPPSFKQKELPPPKAVPIEPKEAPKAVEPPPAKQLEETPPAKKGPPEKGAGESKGEAPIPPPPLAAPKSENGSGATTAPGQQTISPEAAPKGTKGPDGNGKWKDRDKSAGPQGSPQGPGTPPAKLAPADIPSPPAAKQLPPELKAATPPPPPNESETQRVERHRKSFEELKQQRREVKEDGGKRTVIEEPDKRRIIREDGKATIRHDETERFKRLYRDTREERGSDGNNITIAIGPGGIRIMTEVDRDGRALRRWRRGADGRDAVLFDNRSYYRRFGSRHPSFLDAIVNLAPPVIRIPRERYIVEYDGASDDDIYEALTAPLVDDIDHPYSLEEIRQSPYLRDRMRRLDLDTITFDFGSWEVDPRDYGRLERVARVINRILSRNPDEMFLIEGHTDAVGSEEDNLTLSDRRAETVALILTEEFGVPAENLTTQGYGEQFLKVPSDGPERLNRRTSVRRITPLLAR